jgi:hypothetical protein
MACGDGPLFQELFLACRQGEILEKVIYGDARSLARTQRNFYKWLSLEPFAKGLISAKLEKSVAGISQAKMTFRVNFKRETRGRKKG